MNYVKPSISTAQAHKKTMTSTNPSAVTGPGSLVLRRQRPQWATHELKEQRNSAWLTSFRRTNFSVFTKANTSMIANEKTSTPRHWKFKAIKTYLINWIDHALMILGYHYTHNMDMTIFFVLYHYSLYTSWAKIPANQHIYLILIERVKVVHFFGQRKIE